MTTETHELIGPVHILTANECQAEAATIREQLATLILTPSSRRYLRRELRSWERLAVERSS